MPNTLIRAAQSNDLAAISAIYDHHVLSGKATFEIDPPSVDEMRSRHASLVAERYPYLIAEAAGRIVGYAYAGPYRSRPAYRFTVEDSIYLAEASAGRGLGTRLLEELIALSTAREFRQMIAVIGDSENAASIGVHRRCGFELIGVFPKVGYKFGQWIDCVLMQRALGPGASTAPVDPK